MAKLAESSFQQAETVRVEWFATAPVGTERQETLTPLFWTHVTRKLRPLSRVTVMPEDGSWYQELLCVVADGRDIRMHELSFHNLEDTSDVGTSQEAADTRVEWAGPKHLWRVVRHDGVVLAKNLPTRGDANHWVAVTSKRAVA